MKSLRARAVAAGIVWAAASMLLGVYFLSAYLDIQTQRRFDELLTDRHTQIAVAIANRFDSPESVAEIIYDPVYDQPFSGQYWQIEDAGGAVFVSGSLMDTLLPRPKTMSGALDIQNFIGSGGEPLRGIAQALTLDDGSQWHVQVASSLTSLLVDRAALRGNLTIAFGLFTIAGLLGAFLQASAIMRPLKELRRDVLGRWKSDGDLDPEKYPLEVAPLVTDINTLLERNADIVSRSRRQAADLAHAVKTPSAIVRNELEKLQAAGEPVTESLEALDRLDAQLKRSFARMRAEGGNAAMHVFTDLDISLDRMVRAFTAMAGRRNVVIKTHIQPRLLARMDQSDFEEIIGNILENALHWSQKEIHLSVRIARTMIEILIEDDGPGIPEEQREAAMKSGLRLDTTKPGTGLGLAIASELAQAYGGNILLGTSPKLKGLLVQLQLKTSGL